MNPKTLALRVAILAALALTTTKLVGEETFRFRSGDLIIRLSPEIPGGRLALSLGPFGDLTWNTHDGPLDVSARFVIRPTAAALPQVQEFKDLRVAFVLRKTPWLLATGALAGLLVAIDASRRRRAIAAGIGAGGLTLVTIAIVGVSALTFDAKALANPRYRGPVKDAPRIISLLREVQRDWAGVQRNINRTVAGLERLHAQIVTPGPSSETETTRLLVISDIHNNPIGLMIAQQLAERFAIEGVLDAGDLTDRGSQPEAELFARFGDFGLPHAVAPGNHEDRAILDRMRRIDGVTILESRATDLAELAGIAVLGEADPNAYSVDSDPFNERAREQIPELCEALAGRWLDVRAPVVVVHDPQLAECTRREAEERDAPVVIVSGHTHKPLYERSGNVIAVGAGTSGANGFKSDVSSPYGFAIVEFDPGEARAVSVCLFQFASPSEMRGSTCHFLTPEEPQPLPSPSPS